MYNFTPVRKIIIISCLLVSSYLSYGQISQYNSFFDYKNINTQTFIPMLGWNNEQKHFLTVLKHSFEMQQIISNPKDSLFLWNGLSGLKTAYTKDSLIIFFVRPADTITRPCILLTHGNDAQYRSIWHEQNNFLALDLAMRGFCVAYYENPSGREATLIRNNSNNIADSILLSTKNAFYNGFQSAVAANIFVKHNSDFLNVDTTKLFSGGYSFGAFCSLSLATADDGQNFTDSIFNAQGNFTAKSIYNDVYTKNIKSAFGIGSGLPKDDTLSIYNSKMGNFLDEHDNGLALLFLHGRTDNMVYFNLTKLSEPDTSKGYFFAEGPSSMTNTIREKELQVKTTLMVNCRGGHNFSTSVCGYSNAYCMAQWHWTHLTEPPDSLISSSSYFANVSNDSMLRYVAYMLTQVDDVGFVVADFLQPSVSNTNSVFNDHLYFLQPQDSFRYENANGHYITRTTDCEGHPFQVVTSTVKNIITKNEVKIYPNPANNIITIETKENIESISIYSMLGELMKKSNSDSLQEQINVHDLAVGEYIAVIQLKDRLVNLKISVVR